MTIVSAITDVWSDILEWVVSAIPTVVSIFWDSTSGLTFMGTLTLIGLAVGIFFLIMGVIQNFLHLRS